MHKKGRLIAESSGGVTMVLFTDARILDESTVKEVGEELMRLVENTYKMKLLINFQGVEYLSSVALGKLVAVHRKLAEGQGELRLCCIKPAILEVFRITRLDRIFRIYDDPTAALNSFQTRKWFHP
jgi:anti-sigma B factor antagonist